MKTPQSPDIRWKQRLENFGRALEQLLSATTLSSNRPLTDLEKQGLIQAFEFSHELAWKLIKDYLTYQGGGEPLSGSRDATREAFARGLISDGEIWMDMIQSRNLSSHTYNKSVSEDIVQKIVQNYSNSLQTFLIKMRDIAQK